MRFFISYRRRVRQDSALAQTLHKGLSEAGHEVFVDTQISVGTDWAREIAQRIDWCDYVVVLLSQDSSQSEMMQGEIRLAHQRKRANDRPHILPIRVAFDGLLDYELESYIGRLQYLMWRDRHDTDYVLQKLCSLDAAVADRSASVDVASIEMTAERPQDPSRPRPSIDPRLIVRQPGGGLKADDPFYIRRDADAMLENLAPLSGETIVIKAPRQMGKTSLLYQYLRHCQEYDKAWIFVDFQSLTSADLGDYPVFLQRLATAFRRGLRLDTTTAVPLFESQQAFTFYVEDKIIDQVTGGIVIVFDEVDRLLGLPFQRDFFSLLRTWHNYRAQPGTAWENVDLALVISTEPYVLIDRADQSPFNVAPAIELPPFDRSALDTLNASYGGPLLPAQVDQLFELLNGHPYLTRLAFYRLTSGSDLSFDELLDTAVENDGPFGEHLRRLLLVLEEQPELKSVFRRLASRGTVPDEADARRLVGVGLARRQHERVVPANLLYTRFFRAVK